MNYIFGEWCDIYLGLCLRCAWRQICECLFAVRYVEHTPKRTHSQSLAVSFPYICANIPPSWIRFEYHTIHEYDGFFGGKYSIRLCGGVTLSFPCTHTDAPFVQDAANWNSDAVSNCRNCSKWAVYISHSHCMDGFRTPSWPDFAQSVYGIIRHALSSSIKMNISAWALTVGLFPQ